MPANNTSVFSPSLGEVTLYAYNLIGVRNTALLQEHLEAARMATNMLLASFSNRGVNLWEVDKVVVPIDAPVPVTGCSGNGTIATLTYPNVDTPIYKVGSTITVTGMAPSQYNGSFVVVSSAPGTVSVASTATGSLATAGVITTEPGTVATYSVNSDTVVMLDAYMTTPSSGANVDRIILPISRTEYASYPNKDQVGFPTVFWFDRLINPTVTLWPVPSSGQGISSLTYYRVKFIGQASLSNGGTVDVPFLWLDALCYGLAHRLALIWAPDKAAMLKPLADEAYAIASSQNVETANYYISPQVSGYFR